MLSEAESLKRSLLAGRQAPDPTLTLRTPTCIMQTPEKAMTDKDKDKEKSDTKRLARCGKCINCKSQVGKAWQQKIKCEASLHHARSCNPCAGLAVGSTWPKGGLEVTNHLYRALSISMVAIACASSRMHTC